MLRSDGSPQWPRTLVEACVGFAALHGAFNLVVPTEVGTTIRVYAVIAGLTLTVALVGRWLPRRKGTGPDTP